MQCESVPARAKSCTLFDAALAWSAFLVWTWLFIPNALEMLKDLNATVSPPALFFIKLAHYLPNIYSHAQGAGILLLMGLLVLAGTNHAISSPAIRIKVNRVITMTLGLMLIVGIISLSMPIVLAWVRFKLYGAM